MNYWLPEEVIKDIKQLKSCLKEKLVSVSLFGSSTYKQFSEVNDIDIALFVDGISLAEVRDLILRQELSLPTDAKYINGKYSSSIKEIDKTEKHYDFVVLNSEFPNSDFMKINDGKLMELKI